MQANKQAWVQAHPRMSCSSAPLLLSSLTWAWDVGYLQPFESWAQVEATSSFHSMFTDTVVWADMEWACFQSCSQAEQPFMEAVICEGPARCTARTHQFRRRLTHSATLSIARSPRLHGVIAEWLHFISSSNLALVARASRRNTKVLCLYPSEAVIAVVASSGSGTLMTMLSGRGDNRQHVGIWWASRHRRHRIQAMTKDAERD